MNAIGDTAQQAQRRAADPAGSVWVAANAGSGKTRVLTERVARLLLEGAPPQKILCLTYTKAAAAEMQSRLFGMLGGWAMMEEGALREQLSALTGGEINIDLDQARRLFAEALETPGGLKIQTIHAFCDSLLRRFPLEAGAPPSFRMLEGREQKALVAEIMDDLAGGPVFQDIAALLNEDAVDSLAQDVIANRERFVGEVDQAAIAAAFNAAPPFDQNAARLVAIEALDDRALLAMIAAYAAGTDKEQEKANRLRDAFETKGLALAEGLKKDFLTGKGTPLARVATKASKVAEPNWEAHTNHLIDIAVAAREAQLAAIAADRTARLMRFGAALVERYEAAKAAHALLDFDDLVGKAQALLTSSETAQWALYRLDGGVDHILVDEAQDTSPEQWAVIRAIAEEFHAGEGARDGGRTLFVVGDEKQSIYSFQGAAPGEFNRMRRHFDERFLAAETPMKGEELAASFRSAPAILSAVDAVFQDDAADGLSAAGAPVSHLAFHQARAGRVDLWPLVEPDVDALDPEPWSPVDMPAPREPRARLAGIIADHIADLLDSGAKLPGDGRAVRPGDIIILLQSRKPMMAPLIRGLKQRGVPVAGADRLMLTEELAVKDLLALLRFAATPDDDLTLAALLRSPLFDISEEALFALAHGREGTLWMALRDLETREAKVLWKVRKQADFLRPYEILEHMLVQENGRMRMLARLGPEAEDPIDELLAQALAYESVEPPSLEGFLGWMARGDEEIKRDQEGAGGQVRVMTAHGAKGLEAPVVILPDTMRAIREDRGKLAKVDMARRPAAAWKGKKGEEPALLATAREKASQAQVEENRRLLYVAMTRAEDWLIVAGAKGKRAGDHSDTWYGMVEAGLDRLDATVAMGAIPEGLDGEVRRLATGQEPRVGDAEMATVKAHTTLPNWALTRPATARKHRLEPVAASAFGPPHDTSTGVSTLPPEIARRRGEAIHAALEHGAEDAEDIRRIITATASELPAALIAPAMAEAAAARALPEAARYFGADAVAEATISLALGEKRIAGRIDRLCVASDAVYFVDFKSDATPAPPDAPPAAYVAQLAAYRAALQRIYPGKSIVAEILWTSEPRLDRMESTLMDNALAPLSKSSKQDQAED
ncbi:MAG: double-strand break repair helicase AddA [Paracoccaceae bacterium]|nr:double-strand break repair helicase AddA [Paracoccaceae bacterium]